jgi:hypothetical protein
VAAASLLTSSVIVHSRAPELAQKELAFAQVRRPLQGPVAPKKLFPQTVLLPRAAAFVQPSVLQLSWDTRGRVADGYVSAQQRATYSVDEDLEAQLVEVPPKVEPMATMNPPEHEVLDQTCTAS